MKIVDVFKTAHFQINDFSKRLEKNFTIIWKNLSGKEFKFENVMEAAAKKVLVFGLAAVIVHLASPYISIPVVAVSFMLTALLLVPNILQNKEQIMQGISNIFLKPMGDVLVSVK